jgi:hypothetical protein
MLLNLSVRRALTILGGLALVAGAIASTSPAALASTAKPSTAATLCKTNGEEVLSSGPIQLWYSPTCRTTWAVSSTPIGASIWVYNENTGATASNVIPSPAQRTVTAAIDDAGTQSQACEQYIVLHNHLIKFCTGFF